MMSTLEDLLDNEIPTGRKALIDSHHNLPQVASYCEENYDKAINKRQALQETKNYVTQSLASVAYQINTLATSMLNMLDLQATQLSNMETNINHIAQTVSIHKEKVARREIGVLTTSKSCPRTHKIVAPSNAEKQQKYKSTPIDYSVLDDTGHGTKLSNPLQKKESKRSNSVSSTSTSGSADFPVFSGRNPAPPGSGHDTMGSRRRPIAAPPPAPMPPGNYSARHESQSSIHSSVQEPPRTPSLMGAPPPPSLTGRPVANTPPPPPSMTQDVHGPGVPIAPMGAPPPPAPPAPLPEDIPPPAQPPPFTSQLNQVLNRRSGIEHLPPESDMDLPPPPVDYDQGDFMGTPSLDDTMPPPPQFLQADEPSWVPPSYIEKVVAIFDYEATRDDELTFEEGAVIYVLQKNPDGWYEGVMNGYTGLFPGNYVEICP